VPLKICQSSASLGGAGPALPWRWWRVFWAPGSATVTDLNCTSGVLCGFHPQHLGAGASGTVGLHFTYVIARESFAHGRLGIGNRDDWFTWLITNVQAAGEAQADAGAIQAMAALGIATAHDDI